MTDYKDGFGNSQHLRCPICNSKRYIFEKQQDKWVCDDCGEEE
ncbi:MAG: hypothetical protein ACOCV1_06710 [Bacillota bacterium]